MKKKESEPTMSIGIENGAFGINFSAFGTVVLAVFVLLLGVAIKKKWKFAQIYCIPTPVIGGVIFAVLNLLCHVSGAVSIGLDTAYQNDFQYMFFTIVGFGASISLLKKGGSKLLIYFVMVGVIIVLQSAIGVSMAKLVGLPAVFGIVCGPAPLAGGHGSVAAYAQMLEDLGYDGAMVAGMAAATYGLIVGSFFGGPLGERLIRKNHLKTPVGLTVESALKEEDAAVEAASEKVTADLIFKHIALIGGFMVLGSLLGTYLSKGLAALTGNAISLPGFCGPMIVAFVFRNINEKAKWIRINDTVLSGMEDLSLGIFLSMAMIGLKLWQIIDLALPMLAILAVETVVILAVIYFVVFRVMGRDYEAAACCSGLCGHGFGATPNGVANLGAIADRFGYPKMAYIIVPIVGGFLQDLFLVPINVLLINWFA